VAFPTLRAPLLAVVVSAAFYAHLQFGSIVVPVADLHFGVYRTWPMQHGDDLPVNFQNAEGALDARGGLQEGVVYLALPY
jgi:hypothetical protein